ncbi:MAG: gamma-glutamyl-gamma-aminobutyrate hydrolase family protein [Candidatus Verstraetearchaeota archaeon]|nr:gamma-glutamyl-gamma-aminobutyrate hydrolase family protein [Candidatus Verstraetearchaeota archaeon]
MKPMVGITASHDWSRGTYMMGEAYVKSVELAGGIPIIIPETINIDPNEIIDRVDAIILSGGPDIDPYLYGEPPIPKMGSINPLRDKFEIELARKTVERGKPLLAICRGIQVLNVAFNGTLYQDINTQIPKSIRHAWHTATGTEAPPNYPTHTVKIKVGSKLHKIFNKEVLKVNSFHHQAVKDVGLGFEATAWADDGVIEAIEYKGDKFIIGVQWHPEHMWDSEMIKIFQKLVEAAKNN